MENNVIFHQLQSFTMKEKGCSLALGLTVHQQRLRERSFLALPKHNPFLSATCTPNHTLNLSKENISPDVAFQGERSKVNWVKYNILVSIYQNWLRLEPFIRYWLSITYQKLSQCDPCLWPYLRRKKQSDTSTTQKPKDEESDLFDQIRMRREELLKGFDPSSQDVEKLTQARQLAKQLLSSLPLQNNKWTKLRIEKQNRLFDEMIQTFNEQQFQKNSEAIMHSIKQRLYFIDEMQKKYINYSKVQKKMLDQKIELLKQPFKKLFNDSKGKGVQPQNLFQSLWHEIQSERTKVLNKNPQLRHAKQFKNRQRYAIVEKSDSEGLVIKYQLKHGDYFNDSYLRSKYIKSRSRKLKSNSRSKVTGKDDSMQNSKYGQPTKDSVDEMLNQNSQSSIHSQSDPRDGSQEEMNSQYVQDFMRRQKLKPSYRDQTSNFFKKTPTKFQNNYSHYRPSISYIQARSTKDNEFASINSGISISHERTSVFAKRESRLKPSVDDTAEQNDHLSRFKSHKKLMTLKNIGGANRYTRLKDSIRKITTSQGSQGKISQKLSKLQKKEFRKEGVDYRKGALWKKGGNRKDLENSNEQENTTIPENLLSLTRQQFLAYFNKILGSGKLNSEKYDDLREKMKSLISKNEPAAIQQTHIHVEKLVQKSLQDEFRCLLGQGRQRILFDIYDVISKDERIRARIREQMKMFFNDSIEECCSEQTLGNEQYMYNSTELRKVSQQLKRITCFKSEGEGFSFANRLIKETNSLYQCAV